MKNAMVKLAAAMILAGGGLLPAESIYIAQTAQGADNGTSAANAHSAAWFNTAGNWGTVAGKIGPGDTAVLTGTITQKLTVQAGGTAGSPVTILFADGAKMSAPHWSSGALSLPGREHIIIDGGPNGLIEATDNGTGLGSQVDSRGVMIGGDYCEVKNLKISDMYRRTGSTDSFNGGYAISGGGSHLRIHGCTIDDCETGISLSYPGGQTRTDMKVYNNRITRMSNGITIGSGNTDARACRVEVYNNYINSENVYGGHWTPPPGDGHYHNDGIQMWAVHTGSLLDTVLVYGNTIGPDMGWYADAGDTFSVTTGWIFLEGNIANQKIYNNLLVAWYPSGPCNGFITSSGEIYHNTIISWGGGAGIATGGNVDIRNNLIYNCGTAVGINLSGGTVAHFDYNCYYFSGGVSLATIGSGGAWSFYYNFNQWQTGTGFDAHGMVGDPLLADAANFSCVLGPGSPAIGAGADLAGLVETDFFGTARPQGGGWDIGAYEHTTDRISDFRIPVCDYPARPPDLPNPYYIKSGHLKSAIKNHIIYDLSGFPVTASAINHNGIYLLRAADGRMHRLMLLK